MEILVPSATLMPELEKALEAQMKEAVIPGIDEVSIEKVEWVAEGLKVWIRTEK